MTQVVWRVVLLFICSHLSSGLVFPKDLAPIRTIEAPITLSYPWFRGLASDDDSAHLGLDFQKMLKLNQTLFIAARDHVYAIDLRKAKDAILPDKYITWKTQDMDNCAVRGKQRERGYNYIQGPRPKNDQTLIVWGTNLQPHVQNYKSQSLDQDGDEFTWSGPLPTIHPGSFCLSDGNLYSATVADFQASDAVIYRSLGEKSPVLRTVKYDSKWLREPHFIHAVEYGNYVYFFFREISVEYTTLGKVTFSRVARVCKNDMGGSPRVLEKYWTSFLKARLNCSVPGDSFFYFDVLQSVSDILTINNRPAVIGVFGTQANRSCMASRDPYCVWLRSGACTNYRSDIKSSFEQDIGQLKNWGNCQDVTAPESIDSEGDSAYGVRQEVGSKDATKSVHFTFLIGCVFVAFVVGAIFSALFVSCYCNHMFQKNKHIGRDPESNLQRPLSLRSLAKMNGLLETQSKEGMMEPTSPKLYTTLLHGDKEQTETTKAGSKDLPELSGLPTPESTPELPLKNLKAFRNQWERNQNCNNAKEIQGKTPVFHFPVSNSQVFQFPSTVVLPSSVHGYDQCLSGYGEDKKIPNSERALIRHSQCYLPKGVEMTTLDELLKHLPESGGSPRKMSGMLAISPQAVSPHSPVSFLNKIQPKIPDTENAPYYSSSTLPRDSLPRRLDIPPDVTHQSCLEKQSRSQRHSLSSGHKLMNIGPGGTILSRQHSLGQGNRQHPPPLLTRMHSTGTPVPMESHNVFLSRQLSYTEQTPMSRSMVKRTLSLRPDVPSNSVFLPSSPVKDTTQFKY
ncbi:hypothetical protein GDO86_016611 [Hymenochirus boettgeri]|uniref:Sema domain-containing protein n=1 Tax=Hymenochirus boettgeri TaxID=247094 RepID=A0A8T2JXQ4_9PIPI|nr:hypothetical protein GDO86_016611 [Hymenochirus boettgeri]